MSVVEPIDYTSEVGQVRLLMGDVTDPFIFQDEQVAAFITMAGSSIKRAAASGLLVIAANEALLYKYVRTDDLLVDGPKTAAELRAQAKELTAQADAEDAAENEEFFLLARTGDAGACDWEYQEHSTLKPWDDPCH